jgi:hypothetical protein
MDQSACREVHAVNPVQARRWPVQTPEVTGEYRETPRRRHTSRNVS